MSETKAPYELADGSIDLKQLHKSFSSQQTLIKQPKQIPENENVAIMRLLRALLTEQKRTNELLNKIYMATLE